MIEELEEVIDSRLSSIDADSWHDSMRGKRAWELYIGYLYGHPLWTRSEQFTIDEDFKLLVLIWEDGQWNAFDNSIANTAIDAIRELVMQHSEELSRPFNVLEEMDLCDFEYGGPVDLLMNSMVYGQSGRVFGKWYDAYVDSRDRGSLDQGLGERFSEKAEIKADKGELPDLMERCRYHSHGGDPCYLDK